MASFGNRRARRPEFDRIGALVMRRIKRCRSVTLVQLKRSLCASLGAGHFRKRKNADALTDVVEYLLYTKRLRVVQVPRPNGPPPPPSSSPHGPGRTREPAVVFNVITKESLSKFEDAFRSNSTNILAQNLCTESDPFQIALSRQRIQNHQTHQYFCTEIEGSGTPISDQKKTGRCWIFACLNVIRVPFMKTYCLKHFEFSQSYVFFWDKIERSNYFLNAIVVTAKNGLALDSRCVSYLLKKPIEDGGYWTMAVNIINKYGLMPKSNFPDGYNSKHSKELNNVLNSKLREFAIVLRDMVTDGATDEQIADEIEKDMTIVYRIVAICLGIPNQTFKWHYHDDNDQTIMYQNITPLEFYETLVRPVFDIEKKVSLICDPRASNQYGRLYTLDMIGNVIGGCKSMYNNQPIEVLMDACKYSISLLGEPVWYSCDVDQRFSYELGIEDLKIQDINSIFNTETSIPMTKSERISYRDSCPTHAMVLTGFHVDNNEITKWRVENSWGKHAHSTGHLTMTTEWFKEYVFEVVVDKKCLPKSVSDVFEQEPIVLPVWDQLGTSLFVNN